VKNAGGGARFATPATKFRPGTPKACALVNNSGWLDTRLLLKLRESTGKKRSAEIVT
jgi:hypothetical protein